MSGAKIVVREPYYATQCEHCGWVGSSEDCGSGDYWDQDDIICPSCCRSIRGDDPAPEHMHLFVSGEPTP
jgi:hypothetical protein